MLAELVKAIISGRDSCGVPKRHKSLPLLPSCRHTGAIIGGVIGGIAVIIIIAVIIVKVVLPKLNRDGSTPYSRLVRRMSSRAPPAETQALVDPRRWAFKYHKLRPI